jgi:peptidyl-prolyl cis-trans isomerase SurA
MPSKMHAPLVVTTVALALVMSAAATAEEDGRQLVEGIAAVIGDEIILESEVDEELYIYQMRTGTRVAPSEIERVRGEIVREMIDEMLLVAKAHRDTIELAEGELESEIERRVSDLRERHGSDEAFAAALAEQGVTLDELKAIYRDDIERRLLAEKVVRSEVHSKIDITWGEVGEYYEEHRDEVAPIPEAFRVAGILIAPKISESAKRAAIERMTEARTRLDSGEPFETVARELSDDVSASRGGDLGSFGRGTMVPEFEEAAFALEPGEVSGVVPTRFGFHIIEVTGRDGDRVQARHILARVAPGPEDDARAAAVAESLRALAAEGSDFEALAREYSDDEASAAQGGILGWFRDGEMSPDIGEVVGGLEPGEVGAVVPGDSGYYVIKLVDHQEERIASLDEVREDLRDYIYGRKAEEAYAALIERLSQEIFIDVRTGPVAEE